MSANVAITTIVQKQLGSRVTVPSRHFLRLTVAKPLLNNGPSAYGSIAKSVRRGGYDRRFDLYRNAARGITRNCPSTD